MKHPQLRSPHVPENQRPALEAAAGKELEALTAEFYKNEVEEVRKTLNNQGGRNRGGTYMVTDEQRKQLRYSFPNRP